MLEVRGLVKRYGGVKAVDGVSFRVEAGEVVGLLGPNGAGKTSTVSSICGLTRIDGGEILIDGRPVRGDADPRKRLLGLVPQELALIEELSAERNLRFFGSLQGMSKPALSEAIERSLELVGLSARAGDVVRTFSGGMKRRLNIASALLHDPRLVILDEPTVGVDPQSRNAIFEGLEKLRALGKSLLYTTHYMEEAERLCDRVVIVDHGRVAADGDLHELIGSLPARNRLTVGLEPPPQPRWIEPLRKVGGVTSAHFDDGRLRLDLEDLAIVPGLLAAIGEAGGSVKSLATERMDLQTVFLELTGKDLRD
ncbi:MAG: ABC transporter ATP-binding protein [Isosphaeraceae bacterium]|nr:ABC transporter ATP-binding protein [Isosphaeraceae bacterium]